jgi:hypothetical protein
MRSTQRSAKEREKDPTGRNLSNRMTQIYKQDGRATWKRGKNAPHSEPRGMEARPIDWVELTKMGNSKHDRRQSMSVDR